MKVWGKTSSNGETHIFVDVDPVQLDSDFTSATEFTHHKLSRTTDIKCPFGTLVMDTKDKDKVADALVELAKKIKQENP
jgi:hypothetical protein